MTRLVGASWLVLLGVALLVVLPAALWGPMRPAPRPAGSPGPFGPTLALLSTRVERAPAGYVTIHGEVRNLGLAALHRTLAVVTWRDQDGRFVSSDESLVARDPLPAGETSRFTIRSARDPQMSTYAVRFTTLRGEHLASRDDRSPLDPP